MKRIESRKSHSWWWDSHISPKNSKWLPENLEGEQQTPLSVLFVSVFIINRKEEEKKVACNKGLGKRWSSEDFLPGSSLYISSCCFS